MSERLRIINIRRVILRGLDMVYPSGLLVDSVFKVVCEVDESYDFSLLAKDIAYLRGKNYIMYIDEKIGGMNSFKDKTVKLTPEGLEIIQQITEDPALEI